MSSRLYGIQTLRALAAALVVVVHLGRALQLKAGIDPTAVTFNGGAGVDLFFVISGFVMVRTTPRPFPVTTFLKRRLARVAPLYWLLTFVYGTALLVAPGLSHFNSFKLDNFVFAFLFIPSYSAAGNILPPLEQGWTLAYEMFFYVSLALASFVAFRRRILVLGCVFTLMVALGAALPRISAAPFVVYTDPLLLEFLVGCSFGKIYRPGESRLGPRAATLLAGLAVLGIAASPILRAAGWPRVVCWGVPASMAVWAVLQLERRCAFSRMRVVQALGDSSYSIYLTHVFALSLLGLVFRFEGARGATALVLAPAFLAACLAAGWLCHRVIEQPLTRAGRRLLGVDRSRPLMAGLSADQLDRPRAP